jgi:hypothetical protein
MTLITLEADLNEGERRHQGVGSRRSSRNLHDDRDENRPDDRGDGCRQQPGASLPDRRGRGLGVGVKHAISMPPSGSS